jgi:hypothetical protein
MSFPGNSTFTGRRTTFSTLTRVFLALLAIAMISCTRKETVSQDQPGTSTTTTTTSSIQVSRIDLGRELASDRRVITWSTSFKPADTVYAAVVLAAPVPAGQMTARWTSADGQVVYEETQTVVPSEVEAVTQFHMVKPAGLPPGAYKLEVLVDGQVVNSKDFTITAP